MQTYQSTFLRQQYIDADVGGRGGGTVEDAAQRLAMSPGRVRQLVDAGDLDALGVNSPRQVTSMNAERRYE